MLVSGFGWKKPLMGFVFGLGLFALAENALAARTPKHQYWGDALCAECHDDVYTTDPWYGGNKYSGYQGHGHPWQLVQTPGPYSVNSVVVEDAENPWEEGAAPEIGLYPWGVGIPQPPVGEDWVVPDANGLTVEYIIGNFKEGKGSFVYSNGSRSPTAASKYSCGSCHTTGWDPAVAATTGLQKNHLGVAMPLAAGKWAFNGIQCEVCHGTDLGMVKPTSSTRDYTKDSQKLGEVWVCHDCHTSNDTKVVNGKPQRTNRMPFAPSTTNVSTGGFFTGSHPQGDEWANSPHTKLRRGCTSCHDPHLSVWNHDGGVRVEEGVEEGNMCKRCHEDKEVRGGVMGDLAQMGVMECVDCHMPEVSHGGAGINHLFKISTDPAKTAKTNIKVEDGKTYWKTGNEEGKTVLTLDLACTNSHCHPSFVADERGMSYFAKRAKTIHRQPNLIDIRANKSDDLQFVGKGTRVSVDFSIDTSMQEGSGSLVANWYILCVQPNGKWTSWDEKTKKWKKGMVPFRKNTAVADMPATIVFDAPLTTVGNYSYYARLVNPADITDEYAGDAVSLYVSKVPPPQPQ